MVNLKVCAAGAASAFLAATAAGAQTTETSGYVEGALGYLSVDGESGYTAGVNGAFATSSPFLSDKIGYQIDGRFDYVDAGDGLGDDNAEVFSAQGHAYWREENQYTVGASVSIVESDDLIDDTVIGGGVEGDYYVGNWTVGGEAGYYTADDVDIYGVSGGAEYYYNDNLRVGASAVVGQIDNDFADESTYYGGQIEAEWKLPDNVSFGLPVTASAGVSYTEVDDFDTDIVAVRFGLTYLFGSDTLKQRDRSGASRDGANKVLNVLFAG